MKQNKNFTYKPNTNNNQLIVNPSCSKYQHISKTFYKI